MLSKAWARWPTSSLAGIVHGLVEVAGRDAVGGPLQAPDPGAEAPGGDAPAAQETSRASEAREEQEAPLDEGDVGERVLERGRQEHDPRGAEGDRNLGELPLAPRHAPEARVPCAARLEGDGSRDVAGAKPLESVPREERRLVEPVEDDNPALRLEAKKLREGWLVLEGVGPLELGGHGGRRALELLDLSRPRAATRAGGRRRGRRSRARPPRRGRAPGRSSG